MVRVAVLGSDYFQNKRDVTRMRCTRKSLNCTAHAIDDQNNGRWVSANQPMIEHRPHAIQLYLDQWSEQILRNTEGNLHRRRASRNNIPTPIKRMTHRNAGKVYLVIS